MLPNGKRKKNNIFPLNVPKKNNFLALLIFMKG